MNDFSLSFVQYLGCSQIFGTVSRFNIRVSKHFLHMRIMRTHMRNQTFFLMRKYTDYNRISTIWNSVYLWKPYTYNIVIKKKIFLAAFITYTVHIRALQYCIYVSYIFHVYICNVKLEKLKDYQGITIRNIYPQPAAYFDISHFLTSLISPH